MISGNFRNFIYGSAIEFIGTCVAITTSILVAHNLKLSDFGNYALFLAGSSLLVSVLDFGNSTKVLLDSGNNLIVIAVLDTFLKLNLGVLMAYFLYPNVNIIFVFVLIVNVLSVYIGRLCYNFLRSKGNYRQGGLVEIVFRNLVILLYIFTFLFWLKDPRVYMAITFANIFVTFILILVARKEQLSIKLLLKYDNRKYNRSFWLLGFISVFSVYLTTIDLFFVERSLGTEDSGRYKMILQIFAFTGIGVSGVNMSFVPSIRNFYLKNKKLDFKQIIRSQIGMSAFMMGFLIFFYFFGVDVLTVAFGRDSIELYSDCLVFLIFGSIAYIFGSPGFVLMMTEKFEIIFSLLLFTCLVQFISFHMARSLRDAVIIGGVLLVLQHVVQYVLILRVNR